MIDPRYRINESWEKDLSTGFPKKAFQLQVRTNHHVGQVNEYHSWSTIWTYYNKKIAEEALEKWLEVAAEQSDE